MNECPSMSQATFDANEALIREAVKALMGNPQSRKKFRVLMILETYTKERLAEVFLVPDYGPVIAHYSYGDPERLRTIVVGAPRGRGKGNPGEPLVAPLTDDPDQRFPIMARSFKYRFPVAKMRQLIEAGQTKHFVSYSRRVSSSS